MAYVYTCTEGNHGEVFNLGADPSPTCNGGAWVDIQLYTVEGFDLSSLDPELLAAALGAGIVVAGTGMVIMWAFRLILEAIRDA